MNLLLFFGIVLMAVGVVPAIYLTAMNALGKYTGKMSDIASAIVRDNLALVFYAVLMVVSKGNSPVFYIAAVVAGAAGSVMYLIMLRMVRRKMPKRERSVMLLSLAECCGLAVLALA